MRRVGAWAVERAREGRRLSRFRPDNGKERVWGPSPRGRAVLAIDDAMAIAACATCALSLSLRSAPFELLLQKGRCINIERDLI